MSQQLNFEITACHLTWSPSSIAPGLSSLSEVYSKRQRCIDSFPLFSPFIQQWQVLTILQSPQRAHATIHEEISTRCLKTAACIIAIKGKTQQTEREQRHFWLELWKGGREGDPGGDAVEEAAAGQDLEGGRFQCCSVRKAHTPTLGWDLLSCSSVQSPFLSLS